MKKLRIAFIGQRCIPARYGGVETHVEQVATRLAAKGHDVWVYCRNHFKQTALDAMPEHVVSNSSGEIRYKGVRLLFKPSIPTKHLDSASNTFFCALDAALKHDFDIIHFHGIGPSAFAPLPNLNSRRVISTIHALDWRQLKWGRIATWMLKTGEGIGIRHSSGVIAVSRLLVSYLADEYQIAARYIPNGAAIEPLRAPNLIHKFGLQGGDYILTVGRVIPDRNLHDLIGAFKRIEQPIKLVIVGSEAAPTDYFRRLRDMADERVIFTGDQFGDALDELYSNCRLYVLASSVEGLPITVCEAMAHKKCVLLSDIPENKEIGGDAAEYFNCCDTNSLYDSLKRLLEDEGTCRRLGEAASHRIQEEYSWDRIAEAVEAFYYETL